MAKKVKDAIEKSLEIIKNHYLTIESGAPGSRYKSWEYCHSAFLEKKARIGSLTDDDYYFLSLHLGAYLASFGMLRNSFLLERDFLAHYEAVRICMEKDFEGLWDLKPCLEKKKGIVDLLFDPEKGVVNRLKTKAYPLGNNQKDGKEKNPPFIHDVLITKILLGVFGCVPAFDAFFSTGYRLIHDKKTVETTYLRFNQKNFEDIYDMACEYSAILKIEGCDPCYPPMRCLDFALWVIGQCLADVRSVSLGAKKKADRPLVAYGLADEDVLNTRDLKTLKKSLHGILPNLDWKNLLEKSKNAAKEKNDIKEFA